MKKVLTVLVAIASLSASQQVSARISCEQEKAELMERATIISPLINTISKTRAGIDSSIYYVPPKGSKRELFNKVELADQRRSVDLANSIRVSGVENDTFYADGILRQADSVADALETGVGVMDQALWAQSIDCPKISSDDQRMLDIRHSFSEHTMLSLCSDFRDLYTFSNVTNNEKRSEYMAQFEKLRLYVNRISTSPTAREMLIICNDSSHWPTERMLRVIEPE